MVNAKLLTIFTSNMGKVGTFALNINNMKVIYSVVTSTIINLFFFWVKAFQLKS